MTKPMLASDVIDEQLRFPLLAQPKIDGVRALHSTGRITGRSLKPFANKFAQSLFSTMDYSYLDGEMIVGEDPAAPDLCRKTTSALNSIEGQPLLTWYVFDTCHPLYHCDPYEKRVMIASDRCEQISMLGCRVVAVPTHVVETYERLMQLDSEWLDLGYEGTIVRAPGLPYKFGRSTAREGGLLRIKRFTEEDALVLSIVEGRTNDNEAQINELGNTFRSTHQENMVPNGMVGALVCKCLKTGDTITVAAGKMDHTERVEYFRQPGLLVGKVIKYKSFPRGVKDKPRFPTFQCIRMDADRSE